ncbi:unnamed protein product [Ixodes pacificus]
MDAKVCSVRSEMLLKKKKKKTAADSCFRCLRRTRTQSRLDEKIARGKSGVAQFVNASICFTVPSLTGRGINDLSKSFSSSRFIPKIWVSKLRAGRLQPWPRSGRTRGTASETRHKCDKMTRPKENRRGSHGA